MKLLFITSRFPFPLEKGDKLRAFNFIKCLSKNHEVHLFAISEQKPAKQAIKALEPYCKSITITHLSKFQIALNLAKASLNQLPFQVSYFTFCQAKKELKTLQETLKADAALFHLIRTAELADSVGKIPKAIDYMDTFSIGIKRRIDSENIFTKWLWQWEYQKLLHYENAVFNRFKAHTIISEQDRNYLPLEQKQLVSIVPNGVEVHTPTNRNKKYDVIFAGNMSYPPNVEAVNFLVKKIMPIVWLKHPNTSVVIAGAEPSPAVQRLASEKVSITGWVNSIQDYLSESKILVAPMFISIGLQNKLLEAMAIGIPCVTSVLANNALKAQPNKQILVAENAEHFATHIVNLLENQNLERAISDEAYRFVVENYSWNRVTHLLNQMFEKLKTEN